MLYSPMVRYPRPGLVGSYMLGLANGMSAGLGAGERFQARWSSATKLFVLRQFDIALSHGTTAFTAGTVVAMLSIARGWTADGTGGTAIVFSTSNTNKKRTSQALSAFSDTGVRIGSTADLGAGTKTIDTNPIAIVRAFVSSAATTAETGVILAASLARFQDNEYPIILAQDEGLTLDVEMPATGTYNLSITMQWDEYILGQI
jgi:hypothetical protein